MVFHVIPLKSEMKIPYVNSSVLDIDSCANVVFRKPPTADELAELRALADSGQPIALTIGYDFFPKSIGELDLSYIAHIPSLQSLRLTYVAGLRTLDFLEAVPNLRFLHIDATKTSQLSLRPIRFLRSLRVLKLEKQGADLDIVTELPALQYLSVQSSPQKDLSFLGKMDCLRALRIGLGGAFNLNFLKDSKLGYLELYQLRGCTAHEILPITNASHLQVLLLDSLKNVCSLPRIDQVRRLHLREMNGLTDISALASCSKLEELIVEGAKKLTPQDFIPLRGLDTLKRLNAGLGVPKKNEAVASMFNLPQALSINDFAFE